MISIALILLLWRMIVGISLLIKNSCSSWASIIDLQVSLLLIFAVLINLLGAHLTTIRLLNVGSGYYYLSALVNWLHNLPNFYYLATWCHLIRLSICHRLGLLVSINGSWLIVRLLVFIWHLVVYLFIRRWVSKALFYRFWMSNWLDLCLLLGGGDALAREHIFRGMCFLVVMGPICLLTLAV